MKKILQSITLKIVELENKLKEKIIIDEELQYFNRHVKYIAETIEELEEIIDATSDLGDVCEVGRALLMISGKLGDCKNDFEDFAQQVNVSLHRLTK